MVVPLSRFRGAAQSNSFATKAGRFCRFWFVAPVADGHQVSMSRHYFPTNRFFRFA
jgi:hypothetical protein